MFIFFAYMSLALIQLYRRYQRRMQYSAAILRALRSGSILVQRGKGAQHGSVGALLNSSLLSCSRSYKETLLLSDEHLAVSTVSPKQQVDLDDWSSYLDLHPPQTNSNSVVALLEAGPPDSSQKTPGQQLSLTSKVQVLKHGCPLAWKCGSPFGIILHCSYEDFVILCDALGQGQLTLNEDLQLYRMLTISTVGKAKSLRRPRSEEIASTVDRHSPLKTRRANTDPTRLLAAMDGSPPVSFSPTHKAGGDATKQPVTADVDTDFTAEPKVELDAAISRQEKALHAGASVTERGVPVVKNGKTATAAEQSVEAEATENGSDVLVQAKRVVLEESPVVQMSASFANGQENDARALSSGTPDKRESLPTATDDTSSCLDVDEKETPKDGDLSLDSGDSSRKNIPAVPDLNGSEEHTDRSVKDDSSSMTDSQQEFALKESSAEKEELTLSASENVGPLLQKDLNASSLASSKQDAKADTESSAIASDSERFLDKPTSVNGSAHVPNGSIGGAAIEVQSLEPAKEVARANGTESSNPPQGEAEGAPQSESSGNSRNGAAHDSDSGSVGQAGWGKPPNVMVYCGKKDTARKFNIIRQGLEQCLNTSAYTIYPLPHEEVMTLPWEDNSAALIISHDYLHDNISKKFTGFLLKGGKVLSFSSSLEAEFLVRKEVKGRPAVTQFSLQKWRDVSTTQGRYHYVPGSLKKGNSSMDTVVVDPSSSQPLVVRLTLSPENGNGRAIFSQLLLERDPSDMASDSKTFGRLKQNSQQRWEVLRHLLSLLDLDTSLTPPITLTPCYLLAQDQVLVKAFLDSVAGRMKEDVIRSRTLSLKFVASASGASSSALTATNDTLPVVTDVPAGSFRGLKDSGRLQHFDPDLYWRHLETSVLGHVVMYTEVIPTIMTIFQGIQFSIPESVGVLAVAGRQTSGKGRGGNQWLSPAGCAMCALPLRVPADSPLGQRISFLQHIVSLAVVHSIRSLPGYQNLDLRLKWPNDIYYGSETKLGGVLVNSSVMGKTMHATVGCGVNVSNSLPTVCINSIIEDHNRAKGSNLKPLTTSEVLARTVSAVESLVAQFQEKGHQDFCQLYYKYWLHSGASVKVESEGNTEVEITGLDDYGFLRVVNRQGQTLSVQPDGNSFDMMRNLISVKRD